MSAEERRAREDLVAAARSVADRGLSHGTTGNVSVRLAEHILVTPTRSSLATVEAEDLAMIDLDGRPLSEAQPSKEAFLHAAVYRNRPEARAIVHTHSLHATALSCLADLDPRDALPPLTAYYAMRVAALPLVDYCAPGDTRLADLAGQTARDNAAMLLRNHGPVVAAASLSAGVDTAEEIEHTARLFLLLHGQRLAPLEDHERSRLYTAQEGKV